MANASDLVVEVQKKFDAAWGPHQDFVRLYERRERSYRGIIQKIVSPATKWRHQLHPPYVFNLIETVVASTVEQGLQFTARPAPHVNPSLEEALAQMDKAQSIEYLLRHEHRIDEMDDKQRPLFLTEAIGGIGIGKCYWNWTEGTVTKQGVVNEPVHSADGTLLGTVPTIQEITQTQTLRDHSTFEVVDPRDFIVHESAKQLQPWEPGGAQFVIHRSWYSMEQLYTLQASGFLKNVDKLANTRDYSPEYVDRGVGVFNYNRNKDLVEVWEYWTYEKGQVKRAIIGQRTVLLREMEANPFHHGGYPFVVCSSYSQPFNVRGVSQVELIEQLQEILWELQNQRLDNIELINNAIYLVRSDIDDPDAFEHYPGARWPVSSTSDVEPLIPPYQLAELTMPAEEAIKADLQYVTSSVPLAGGNTQGSSTGGTATEASLVMNTAQKALTARKYESQKALRQEANMRLKNCQQFIRSDRLVQIVGQEGAMDFLSLTPLDIQGEYYVELSVTNESENRQEKRSEAMQLVQVLAQIAPLAQAMGTPMDMKQVILWALKRWDIEYGEIFFSAPQPPAGGMPAPGGAQPGLPAPGGAPTAPEVPGQPNLGITSGQAVDANSPSALGGVSGSPVVAMQRAGALGGGVSNV